MGERRDLAATADGGGMMELDFGLATAENYRRFARHEAAGRSKAYEVLALAAAGDPPIPSFLGQLPVAKQQPNLLFASARYLLGAPAGPDSLRDLVSEHGSQLAAVITARRTQTNEPARCALLLPRARDLAGNARADRGGRSGRPHAVAGAYSYDYRGRR